MLKKTLFIMTAIFAVVAFQTPVFAEAPAQPLNAQSGVTPEEVAALQALQQALAAATSNAEKQQILADAIAATPTLASKPQLSSVVQSTAIQVGLSVAQIDSAVISGLSRAQAPAAGGSSSQQQTVKNINTGGGGLTSTETASQASL